MSLQVPSLLLRSLMQEVWVLLAVLVIPPRFFANRYRNSEMNNPRRCLMQSRPQIQLIKKDLKNKNAPFGVDLLLPQVGGSARKTNVSVS